MALSPLDLTFITLKDLSGNWIRSGLTALGIFMGVAAVNGTLNLDAITAAQIQQKLAERDNPFISPQLFDLAGDRPTPTLTAEDFAALKQEVPGIADISTVTNVFTASGVQYQGTVADQVTIRGVSDNFQTTTGRRIVAGRFFEPVDFERFNPATVIDQTLAEQLFAGESPVGRGIFVGGNRFTVVGVSETKKQFPEEKPSGELWITQNYAEALAGGFTFGSIQISIKELQNYSTVEEQVETVLNQRYPGFEIFSFSNAADLYQEEQQQRTSARVLTGVGVFALTIGGVGIANITMAAVMERTREIGLRRAIGATDLEVMMQFIMEAAVLSVVGGLAAVTSIHFLTQAATTRVFEAPYEFSIKDAGISMGAAFAIGVGASFLPALRVTRIDIVQALRGD